LSRADKAIVNYDDENLYKIIKKLKTKVVTFGQGDEPDYRYKIVGFYERGFNFTLSYRGKYIGDFSIKVPGVFNVTNAAAAVIAALESGVAADTIAEGISGFSGISRRLEHIGDRYGRRVFYDYAHHPTEIRCVINTVRMLYGDSVTVIFQPHTFTRTKSLWDGVISSLGIADYAVLLDVYPAREKPIDGISSERLAGEIGKKASYLSERELLSYIDKNTYGAIIVMGAGDMENVKNLIIDT
jgi:UDP-N-acetylmuramate--alanine ligase